jgi:diguanylate cyclase (GGDEF)-like protein/PAS domain S-box-containing protein
MRHARQDLPILVLVLALLGMLVPSLLVQREIRLQTEAAGEVAQTLAVLFELERVESGVAAAESGVRGFGISRDQSLLVEFDEGMDAARSGTDALGRLVAGSEVQQERLENLAAVVLRRLELLQERKRAVVAGGAPTVSPEARVLTGEIRERVSEMQSWERDLLERRRLEASRRTGALLSWSWLVIGAGMASGLLGLLWIVRSRRQRQEVEDELVEKHGIVQAVLDGTTDAVYVKDLDGRYLLMNTAGARMMGRSPDQIVGKLDSELFSGESAREIGERDFDALRAGGPRTVEASAEIGGARRFYLTTRAPYREPTGRILGMVGITRDITEEKTREERKFRELSLLLELAELLQACRSVADAYEVAERMGPRLFPKLSGAVSLFLSSRNLVEKRASWGPTPPVDDSLLLFAPDDCWALRRGRPHHADGVYSMSCRHVAAPGATLCTPLLAQGELLGVLHLGGGPPLEPAVRRTASLVAEQLSTALANLQLREVLKQQSIRDPLTGLYNRRFAEDALRRELSRAARQQAPVAVLALDLDHFKRINDTYGHEGGDRVLRKVGALLLELFRGEDVVARMGGEELLVILPGMNELGARARAEEVRLRVSALEILQDGQRIGPVTVSIGLALSPAHGTTDQELVREADAALYAAKRGGRDRVLVADVRNAGQASWSRQEGH